MLAAGEEAAALQLYNFWANRITSNSVSSIACFCKWNSSPGQSSISIRIWFWLSLCSLWLLADLGYGPPRPLPSQAQAQPPSNRQLRRSDTVRYWSIWQRSPRQIACRFPVFPLPSFFSVLFSFLFYLWQSFGLIECDLNAGSDGKWNCPVRLMAINSMIPKQRHKSAGITSYRSFSTSESD